MNPAPDKQVSLLTAGRDPHYAYGMAKALMAQKVQVELIGGNDLDCPEWNQTPFVRFRNLKGDASDEASFPRKAVRILVYYAKLIGYAFGAEPKIFHILWNNKFETVDRVALMLLYKLLGKKVTLTVHNVNAKTRDSGDTAFNRFTLKIQYRLADHLFVHTELMKKELETEFAVPGRMVTVIPFGINNAVPNTPLTRQEARHRLGLQQTDKVLLFYGHIAPYKGLEYLLSAFEEVLSRDRSAFLIVAGKPENCEAYWDELKAIMKRPAFAGRILQKIEHISDDDTEVVFKATDAFVLPYRHIYQSGVLFLGYSYGVPVIAADVGTLKEDIVEGKTGFVCKPDDAGDLARAFETYFASSLCKNLSNHRQEIQDYVRERHSWDIVGKRIVTVYKALLKDGYLKEEAQVQGAK